MGNIEAIAAIADDKEKLKEISYKRKLKENQGMTFQNILQQEIDKLNKEATKDTDQSSPR